MYTQYINFAFTINVHINCDMYIHIQYVIVLQYIVNAWKRGWKGIY